MTPEEALTTGFQRWLDLAVPSERASVAPVTMDPFASSMRYPWQAVEGLLQARSGAVTTSDPPQRFGDMRRAGLVDGSAASASLTALGFAVVTQWETYGLLDPLQDDTLDFARTVGLADTALRLRHPDYQAMMKNWRELAGVRPATEWFADPWSIVAATYLSVEHDGYNPFRVLLSAGVPVWSHRDDLTAWAASEATPAGWARSRLGVVLQRIEGNVGRGQGKMRFYQALEAVRLRDQGASPAVLKATITEWGV